MKIHWLQHVPFEGLGSISNWAEKCGHQLTCTRLWAREELPGIRGGAGEMDVQTGGKSGARCPGKERATKWCWERECWEQRQKNSREAKCWEQGQKNSRERECWEGGKTGDKYSTLNNEKPDTWKQVQNDEFDALIVMGGPMGIHDEEQFLWLKNEKAFIKQVIDTGTPVLGICLGAQLIADVLGARVYPGPHKEIGWFPVRLTAYSEAHGAWGGTDDENAEMPKEGQGAGKKLLNANVQRSGQSEIPKDPNTQIPEIIRNLKSSVTNEEPGIPNANPTLTQLARLLPTDHGPRTKDQFPCLQAFHWHGDTFDLPKGAVRLFESEACKNQGFIFGNHVLALQFHLETTAASAQALVENCSHELVAGPFIQTAEEILKPPAAFESLNRHMEHLLDQWLHNLLG